jgi:hypothetical protein
MNLMNIIFSCELRCRRPFKFRPPPYSADIARPRDPETTPTMIPILAIKRLDMNFARPQFLLQLRRPPSPITLLSIRNLSKMAKRRFSQ